MKTNDLRKLIYEQLQTVNGLTNVYCGVADEGALYPHAVYELRSVGTLGNDLNRYNYLLYIDVWDRSTSETDVLTISDAIADLFNAANLPQTGLFPTFYLEDRQRVEDEDKRIKHEVLRFTVQTYFTN